MFLVVHSRKHLHTKSSEKHLGFLKGLLRHFSLIIIKLSFKTLWQELRVGVSAMVEQCKDVEMQTVMRNKGMNSELTSRTLNWAADKTVKYCLYDTSRFSAICEQSQILATVNRV